MIEFDFKDCKLIETDGVFTLKNINTTIGFVRFNKIGEVEYIFVNPIFRNKGIAKKLLKNKVFNIKKINPEFIATNKALSLILNITTALTNTSKNLQKELIPPIDQDSIKPFVPKVVVNVEFLIR